MTRPAPSLILSPVPDDETAQRLAAALRRWGVEPFVTRTPWQGRPQVVVGYYARNDHEECLLDDLLQAAGIDGPAWRQAAAQATPQDEQGPERLAVAFSTQVPAQAQLLCGLLEQAGIEALATDQLAGPPAGPPHATVQVLVRSADLAGALDVVGRMQAQADAREEDLGSDEAETLVAWPRCPACGAPRETCCPKCRTTGSQWQQADPRYLDPEEPPEDAASGDSGLLVICPTCDWLFAPRFYRRCPMCSHDFGSGIEAEARAVSEAESFNPRVIAVVLALGVLLLAVLAFFALVGRN